MALEALQRAPVLDDFTLLADHEQQTPGSFFDAKPVLHLRAPAATVKVSSEQWEAQPLLHTLAAPPPSVAVDGTVLVADVDVWVTSRHVLLYSLPRSSGVQISYPSIAMNAQDGRDILLELNLSDADTADEDIQCLSLRIHASKIENNVSAADHLGATANGTTSHNDVAAALFQAISDCQELNPDPPGPGDEGEDGVPAFDETAPGATGWITSENMADFMDEDGNFRIPEGVTVIGDEESGPQTLGEGAGRTRTAAEAEVGNEATDDADETKWQRTE